MSERERSRARFIQMRSSSIRMSHKFIFKLMNSRIRCLFVLSSVDLVETAFRRHLGSSFDAFRNRFGVSVIAQSAAHMKSTRQFTHIRSMQTAVQIQFVFELPRDNRFDSLSPR